MGTFAISDIDLPCALSAQLAIAFSQDVRLLIE
jgi:hypothetical protein